MSEVLEITTEHITVPVSDGSTLPAYIARPKGDGPFPGIIVYQEAFGVNHHIREMTDRFARAGYVAIAPALFHRTDPSFESGYDDFSLVMPHYGAVSHATLTADATAAFGWLTSPDGGGVAEVVSVGYCLGGQASFLTGIVLPVKAAVSYYGGGIAPNPERGAPGLLSRVSEMQAPILLVWGAKDAHLGPDVTRSVDEALTEAGKMYSTITFGNADHGFSCDERASYEPLASKQAWALTLAFFESYLGPAGA